MNTQDIILNVLYSAAITNIFVLAEPVNALKELLGFKEEDYDTYTHFKKSVYRLINCALCSGIYISAIIFCNQGLSLKEFIGLVCVSAVASELINRKLR